MRPPALHAHVPHTRTSTRAFQPLLSGGPTARGAAAIPSRAFWAQTARRNGDDKSRSGDSINPQFPKVTLESLGVSGPLKWVLVGLLTVFGTIETWVLVQGHLALVQG